MKNIYFKGLNGVRFFAALLVIIDHTELFKSSFGHQTLWENNYSSYIGAFGVSIFFVLSGFLITYLLLAEQQNSTINIKHFYIRRILRIWPVYYLLVIIAFFIVPHIEFLSVTGYSSDMIQFQDRLFLYSGLLANVAFVYLPTVAFANILWSVAVEEQFYLFWPHIVRIKKHLLIFMIVLLTIYFFIKVLIGATMNDDKLYALITRTRFSAMIIGGIGAYFVFNESVIIKQLIYKRFFQVLLITLFVLLLIKDWQIPFFGIIKNEFTSVIVCCLIINIATNTQSIINLENKLFNYFGKISYGLYVYHLFAVVITLKTLPILIPSIEMSSIIGYTLTIGLILIITTIISHLSYFYFESYFLKLKNKFSNIISGDMAKSD